MDENNVLSSVSMFLFDNECQCQGSFKVVHFLHDNSSVHVNPINSTTNAVNCCAIAWKKHNQ